VFRRRLRLSAAAGTSLLIVASAAVSASPQAAATPTAAVEDAVRVTIDSFAPSTPKPGDAVTISGTVTNTSSVIYDNPQAIACIDKKRLATAQQIASIPDEEGLVDDSRCISRDFHAASTAYDPLGVPLAPQATVPFKLVVKWGEWEVADTPGVYVVGVNFRGNPSQGDRDTAGQARILMPVISKTPMPRKVNTALVLPLIHRPTLLADHLFANDSLAQSMAPTGRLGRLLALGKNRTVSWLVDPAMIAEARLIANSDAYRVVVSRSQSKAGTGRKIVKDWLNAFDESRHRNPVVLLPYGDPNIASLVSAGGSLNPIVTDSRSASEGFPLGPPSTGDPSGIWLEGGAVTTKNLITGSTGFAGARTDDVNIVTSSSWSAKERPNLLPSPVYNVLTPAGPPKSVRVLIANSALLEGGPDPATAGDPLQVQQRFAAETALIAGSGAGPATVVVAPPRGWDNETQATTAVVRAMSAPWITPIGINQVVNTAPPATKAPAVPAEAAGLPAEQLDRIKSLSGAITTYKSLLHSTSDDTPPNLKQGLLRSASSGWTGFPDQAQGFVAYQQTAIAAVLNKVRLVSNNTKGKQGIKVNLSGSKGSFPLTVENGLDVTIRIGLEVSSTGNRNDLKIAKLKTLVLSAGQKGTFNVKASAEQNGLINANAQLISAGEAPVGSSQPIVIQAAQYGSVGWILVGAAVALLFGTSIVRIYRRIRSERRNPPAPEADALHPAPLAPEDLGAEDPAAPEPELSGLESLKEGVGTKDG